MNITTATGQVIQLANAAWAGTVTLVEVGDTLAHHTVYLVVPDERAAQSWGCPGRAGTVVGGLTRDGSRWAPTAYADRLHMRTDAGPVYYLPNAASRAAGARALLRWWNTVTVTATDQPEVDVRNLNPLELPTRARHQLVA